MKDILVITNSAKILNANMFNRIDRNTHYYIHTINANSESVLQDIKKMYNCENIKISSINNINLNKIAESEARELYIRLIRDIPNIILKNNKSIAKLLTVKNRNNWWYYPVSEKNIWIDKTIHRIYETLRFKHIIKKHKYSQIKCYLDDSILLESFSHIATNNGIIISNITNSYSNIKKYILIILFILKYINNSSKAFISTLIKKSILSIYYIHQNNTVSYNSIGIFSYFPLYWKDINTRNPINIFFNKLPNEMSKVFDVTQVIWLSPWRKIFHNPSILRKLCIANKIYILDRQLNILDILSVFKINIIIILLTILKYEHYINEKKYSDIKVEHIIFDELIHSFSSPTYFESILIDKAFQNSSLERLSMLIYRLEFQPHEKAILYNIRGKIKSVGYQHSALSSNFLNYVFMNDELQTHWNSKNDYCSMPLPDHIFTSGIVGYNFMKKAGYPTKNIDIVGAIRFSEIYNHIKLNINKNELRINNHVPLDKIIIFTPTSLLLDETINMLDSLIFALNGKYEDYYIIIKLHPAADVKIFKKKINHYLNNKWNSNSYLITSQSVNTYDYILLSDLSILLGGSLAIEALALGGNILVYIPINNFSHNPIADYLYTVRYAFNGITMRNELNLLIDHHLYHNQTKVIKDMFDDLTENPYEKFINGIIKIYNGAI